jgi:hypothetical protein
MLDRVECRATTQRKAAHSSLPKGTADKSNPYTAAPPLRLAHDRHGQLPNVTVSQNLENRKEEDAPIFAAGSILPLTFSFPLGLAR